MLAVIMKTLSSIVIKSATLKQGAIITVIVTTVSNCTTRIGVTKVSH